jgi:hypothetical protein
VVEEEFFRTHLTLTLGEATYLSCRATRHDDEE